MSFRAVDTLGTYGGTACGHRLQALLPPTSLCEAGNAHPQALAECTSSLLLYVILCKSVMARASYELGYDHLVLLMEFVWCCLLSRGPFDA